MTYDEFIDTFRPVKNHFEDAAFDGYLFETYAEQADYVRWQPERRIWTIIEGDDGELYLVDGYHWVNRLGYFITEVPWSPGFEYEIPLD